MIWRWTLRSLSLFCILSIFLFSVLVPMNMLVWNCRGAGDRRFPGLIRDCAKIYQLNFLAILEPRISGIRANKVADKFGFSGAVRVEAVGFAGGIWCFWKRNLVSMDVVSTSKYCVVLKVNPRSPNPWLLSVVYGSPQERFRDELWEELRAINNATELPWCVLGDFNAVLHSHEKSGGWGIQPKKRAEVRRLPF